MIKNIKIENIYCVGRNFEGHAKELGNKVPTSPLIFQKSNSTINTKEKIEIPKNQTIEHELEIVVLIGKDGAPKTLKDATAFISGFSLSSQVAYPYTLKSSSDSEHLQLMRSVGCFYSSFSLSSLLITVSSSSPQLSLPRLVELINCSFIPRVIRAFLLRSLY